MFLQSVAEGAIRAAFGRLFHQVGALKWKDLVALVVMTLPFHSLFEVALLVPCE